MYRIRFQQAHYLTVHENGEFDLSFSDIGLYRCFPGINDARLMVSNVRVEANDGQIAATYTGDAATLVLTFTPHNDYLNIHLALHNTANCSEFSSISCIEQAYACGFAKILRHGYFSWETSAILDGEALHHAESHGLAALLSENENVLLGADRHDTMRHEFLFDASAHQTRFSARAIVEGKNFALIQQFECANLIIFQHPSLDEAQHIWADMVAHAYGLPPQKTQITGWCSWYYDYYWFNGDDLEAYLEGMSPYREALGLNYFLIDANHFRHVGDWLDTHPNYPKGLSYYAHRIREHGYVPGIWVGPFMVGNRSKLYREHPDWMLKSDDDQPIPYMTPLGEESVWAYRDKVYYCLDTSHPDAMAYVKHVFRTLYEWGFRYFKTDFMYWGAMDRFEGGWFYQGVNGHNYIADKAQRPKIKRFAPGKTGVEYFVDTLKTIREAIGDESIWLGCGQPLWMSIGYVDAMRISRDMGPRWRGGNSPQELIQDLTLRNFVNSAFYQADPDCILLRHVEHEMTDREITALALYMGVSQGVIVTSDPLHECSAERRELFRFVQADRRVSYEQPLLGKERDVIIYVGYHPETQRYSAFFFNPTNAAIERTYSFATLDISESCDLYAWKTKSVIADHATAITVTLEPHDAALFFLSAAPFAPDWQPERISG